MEVVAVILVVVVVAVLLVGQHEDVTCSPVAADGGAAGVVHHAVLLACVQLLLEGQSVPSQSVGKGDVVHGVVGHSGVVALEVGVALQDAVGDRRRLLLLGYS